MTTRLLDIIDAMVEFNAGMAIRWDNRYYPPSGFREIAGEDLLLTEAYFRHNGHQGAIFDGRGSLIADVEYHTYSTLHDRKAFLRQVEAWEDLDEINRQALDKRKRFDEEIQELLQDEEDEIETAR